MKIHYLAIERATNNSDIHYSTFKNFATAVLKFYYDNNVTSQQIDWAHGYATFEEPNLIVDIMPIEYYKK